MKKLKKLTMTLVALFALTTGAWADTTVTFTASDLVDGSSITKDGVTLTSYGQNGINVNGVNGPGEFTNSLGGNFTKIVVTADGLPSGDGWSTGTWTGSASSVSFTGDIEYYGEVSIVCTLETPPAGPEVAQSYEVKVFNLPASWANDQTPISPADMPEDFVQITKDEAKALAVPDGGVYLIYGFNGDNVKVMEFDSGFYMTAAESQKTRGNFIGYQTDYNAKICYTASAGTALTPDATRKVWTLAAMPVYDVELMVEYYPGMFTLGGDATEGGTLEVVGLTGDALPAGFEKDAEGNIYVAQGTTFTVKATPEEGYHFVCWSDDQNNTNPEREITMPADGSDLSLTATFAENEYDITFSEGTNPDPEHPEWTATPNPAKTKQTVTVTYSGTKKVIGVKAEKKAAVPTLKDALANGATVVINFTWWGESVTTFTYTNNGGTYTGTTTGVDADYFNNGMSIDGTTLKFTASNTDQPDARVSIDFYTDTNEYYFNGKGIGFTSFTISVNGTDLTSQLKEVK